ncbi:MULTISPECIES: hypothetical protein [unclassified Bradyrhizobium]|uniref:hypothetical protein n=1 Tax=unclassified Bradyrhizobium TaxID=2631580 RepID=UPI00201298A6|nr:MULTISPECIES: hypothetical protein [unclassified Bradyrhizobium]
MRKTEAVRLSPLSPDATSPASWGRGLRIAACVLGIGLCVAANAARAGDDDEEDSGPIEDRIIKNIVTGLGGTNMDNRGINYRERSPLVVPRTTDLPPPADTKAEVNPPNWPKDPTIAAEKASAEASKRSKPDMFEMSRTLTPAELAPKRAKGARSTATVQQPGSTPDAYGGTGTGPMLSPGQLGFSNSMFSSVFKGNSTEIGQFKGEPTRDNLTQPPVGYQTPSPDYAYGTGAPRKPIDQQAANPFDPNSGVKKNN